jgi:uncharacterized protein YndB with AHSA1/START domain
MTTTNPREVRTGGRHPMTISEGGDGSATIERYFDAPPELVYEIVTDPQLVPEWYGPRRFRTEVVEMDVRVGGTWHFANVDDDGNRYEFKGQYLELDPPRLVKQTWEFLGMPGAVSTETMTLTAQGDGTLVHVVADYGSPEAAAGAIGSGMEHGASETYDRLEELLDART